MAQAKLPIIEGRGIQVLWETDRPASPIDYGVIWTHRPIDLTKEMIIVKTETYYQNNASNDVLGSVDYFVIKRDGDLGAGFHTVTKEMNNTYIIRDIRLREYYGEVPIDRDEIEFGQCYNQAYDIFMSGIIPVAIYSIPTDLFINFPTISYEDDDGKHSGGK